MSGLPTIEQILKKKYPDINFELDRSPTSSYTTIILTSKRKDGTLAMCRFQLTDTMVEMNPEIIKDFLENAIQKLREYCGKECMESGVQSNPSSRWFGLWDQNSFCW